MFGFWRRILTSPSPQLSWIHLYIILFSMVYIAGSKKVCLLIKSCLGICLRRATSKSEPRILSSMHFPLPIPCLAPFEDYLNRCRRAWPHSADMLMYSWLFEVLLHSSLGSSQVMIDFTTFMCIQRRMLGLHSQVLSAMHWHFISVRVNIPKTYSSCFLPTLCFYSFSTPSSRRRTNTIFF